MTRFDIYDVFARQWFRRELNRLKRKNEALCKTLLEHASGQHQPHNNDNATANININVAGADAMDTLDSKPIERQ